MGWRRWFGRVEEPAPTWTDGEFPAQLVATEALRDAGAGEEEIMRSLRAQGIRKGRSIQLMQRVFDLEHKDAKLLVHFSDAWADTRTRDEALHEDLSKALDQLIEEDSR